MVHKEWMVHRDGHPVVLIELAKIIDGGQDGVADEPGTALSGSPRKARMRLEVRQQISAERYEGTRE